MTDHHLSLRHEISFAVNSYGVVANVQDCDIVISEFEFHQGIKTVEERYPEW